MSGAAKQICILAGAAMAFFPARGGLAARRRFFAVLSAFAFAFPSALQAGKIKISDPKTSAALSRLEKSRRKGDLFRFRMELEALLEGPAKKFFFAVENLFDPKRRKKTFSSTYHLVLLPGRNQFTESFSAQTKSMVAEEIAMAQALLPPLGKRDRDGLTPEAAAVHSENHAAQQLFRLYEAPNHEIYDEAENTVWGANPAAYPEEEDNIWRKLPETPLEDTAAGSALLKGDFDGFLKAAAKLYEGPAWKVLALLHSRETKTRKTIFHLLAEARPSLSEIIRPAVFARLREAGLPEAIAEKHSQQLSEDIGARQQLLKNGDFQAARLTSNKIYLYLAEINELSDNARNDFLSLEETDADEKTANKIIRERQAQAANLFGNLIETAVPMGLSGFRKDKEKTKEAYIKAMFVNGTAAAASWGLAAGAYDINMFMAGSGLALAGGLTSVMCYKAFQSYRELRKGEAAPPMLESSAPPL